MDDSNYNEFVRSIRSATPTNQALLFLYLSHAITTAARESYPSANDRLTDQERFAVLQDINELQHRIVSHCLALLKGDRERFPDDVICRMLRPSEGDNAIVSNALNWALGEGLRLFNRTTETESSGSASV